MKALRNVLINLIFITGPQSQRHNKGMYADKGRVKRSDGVEIITIKYSGGSYIDYEVELSANRLSLLEKVPGKARKTEDRGRK